MLGGRKQVIVVFNQLFCAVLRFCIGTPSEDAIEETPSTIPSEVSMFGSVGSNGGVVSLCNWMRSGDYV